MRAARQSVLLLVVVVVVAVLVQAVGGAPPRPEVEEQSRRLSTESRELEERRAPGPDVSRAGGVRRFQSAPVKWRMLR